MPKDFKAGLLGQIQVQQDQVGSRSRVVGVRTIEKLNGFLTIADDMKDRMKPRGLQRLENDKNVALIVLNQKNLERVRGCVYLRLGE